MFPFNLKELVKLPKLGFDRVDRMLSTRFRVPGRSCRPGDFPFFDGREIKLEYVWRVVKVHDLPLSAIKKSLLIV
jgi:hypothetical protein